MGMRLTLTARHTLFLTAVIFVMLLGSYVVTFRVVRAGLKDLLLQRLTYAELSLEHYWTLRDVARSDDLRTLLSSPRFIAAIATGDNQTISEEAPGYMNLVNADFILIADASGKSIYSSLTDSVPPDISRLLSQTAIADTLVIGSVSGQLLEVSISNVVTVDGFTVGRAAIGFNPLAKLLEDMQRLTGFDLILTADDGLLNYTNSALVAHIFDQDQWPQLISISSAGAKESTIDEMSLLHCSVPITSLNITVTFVTSVDDHILPILSSQLITMSIMALVASALAILAVYWYTRRHIGNQMNHLVSATEKIALGEMNFRIDSLSSDEFGTLALHLDRMRANLLQNRLDLEKAHADQVRAERLASIGQVATGIIHDFKNPIHVIRMCTELAAEDRHEANKLKRYFKTIRDQTTRMVELCQDILDYAGGQSNLEVSPVDLGKYLREICEKRAQECEEKGISIRIDEQSKSIVNLDPVRFRRVLDNLLSNAIEAMSDGGEISISWTSGHSNLEIIIEDNGPGIPGDIVESIFEPFVTKGKQSGTGLGLAICKKIVEDHGGAISVSSSSDSGTTFSIVLPQPATSKAPVPVLERSGG